jgi:hypothetical protein
MQIHELPLHLEPVTHDPFIDDLTPRAPLDGAPAARERRAVGLATTQPAARISGGARTLEGRPTCSTSSHPIRRRP